MKQPGICERNKRGKVTYYCQLGGKQHALGNDAEQAQTKFAELLLKHRTREELAAQVQPSQPTTEAQPGLSVRAVLLAFLDWCKRNRAVGTHQFYKQHIDQFDDYLTAEKLTDLLVSDFGPQHVEDWIESKYAKTSDTYRHNLIRCVQAAFAWAMNRKDLRRQIGEHPLIGLEKPSQQPSDVYVTEAQWAKIVAELKAGPLLDFLTVMRETGCRVIEARLVTAAEFDRDNRQWYFADPPKKVRGKKRPRVVLLNERALAICERLAAENPTGALFRNERDGVAWSKNALIQQCTRLSKKLGFRFTPKALRHSFCTDALRRDINPVKVATLMGHRDASMVLTVYQKMHKCQDDLRAALDKATAPAA